MHRVYKALADPTRRRIMELLRQRRMTAGEIADHFDLAKPTLSKHFSILKEADLIRGDKVATTITYRLNVSVLEEALIALTSLFDDVPRRVESMKATYSEEIKAAMQRAREESARLGHNYIGTEHLLLGIIKDGQGEAVTVLARLGVKAAILKQAIEDYVASSGGRDKPGKEPPFTPRAKQILEIAAQEASAMQSPEVGGVHLLLALLKDREGVAAQILAAFGVDYPKARAAMTGPETGGGMAASRSQQRIFILYYHPVLEAERRVVENTNLEQLNQLLAEGWTIAGKEDLGGRGAEGYHVSFLRLSRNGETDD
jgi:DNA-binding transcriptional ArsR family regulator